MKTFDEFSKSYLLPNAKTTIIVKQRSTKVYEYYGLIPNDETKHLVKEIVTDEILQFGQNT